MSEDIRKMIDKVKNFKQFVNENINDKVTVYIVAGMYNDDIDGITGNPYLEELVTTDLNKAITYFKNVTLKSNFFEIKNGDYTKVDNVVDYVEQYANFEEESHECFMDITLDRCEIRKDLYNKNIDGWKIREYADYHCDTIEEKKLFFDGSVGSF
jgi:hypothetical protein